MTDKISDWSCGSSIITAPLDRFDERYDKLRIPHPGQVDAMASSMSRFGQLTPVVACPREEFLALVDGFKRLQASEKLGLESLEVRVLPLSEQAAVAAVYSLNRCGRGLYDFEEALVVHALCRNCGLSQVDTARLLDRHKSWVSRRLMLIERLDPQIQDDLRVGLVGVTVAREIAQLPRGNQPEVAVAVHRHGLTSREASDLVTLFEKTKDRSEQEELLRHPRERLEAFRGRPSMAPYDRRLSPGANGLRKALISIMEGSARLLDELRGAEPSIWSHTERTVLSDLIRRSHRSASVLTEALHRFLQTVESFDE